jgi:hypothetical protein
VQRIAFVVVLLGLTGVNLVFRNLYGSVDAARGPDREASRAHGLDQPAAIDQHERRETLEDIAPALARCAASLGKDAEPGDLLLARIAAECGNHLFEKAVRSPENTRLANQAALHYRACLAHEPTARDAGNLFRDVRARLEQLDRLQARRDRPAAEPKAAVKPPQSESKPVVQEKPAPEQPAAEKDEPLMVGPDGVTYRRNRP